jgi:hypothetical protein
MIDERDAEVIVKREPQPTTRTAKLLTVIDGVETLEDIAVTDLKAGMTFKLYEEDGTPIMGLYCDLFLATTDVGYNDDGILQMNIEMLGEPKNLEEKED